MNTVKIHFTIYAYMFYHISVKYLPKTLSYTEYHILIKLTKNIALNQVNFKAFLEFPCSALRTINFIKKIVEILNFNLVITLYIVVNE